MRAAGGMGAEFGKMGAAAKAGTGSVSGSTSGGGSGVTNGTILYTVPLITQAS